MSWHHHWPLLGSLFLSQWAIIVTYRGLSSSLGDLDRLQAICPVVDLLRPHIRVDRTMVSVVVDGVSCLSRTITCLSLLDLDRSGMPSLLLGLIGLVVVQLLPHVL